MQKIHALLLVFGFGSASLVGCTTPKEAQLQLENMQLRAQLASQQQDVELVRQLKQQSGLSDAEFYAKMKAQPSLGLPQSDANAPAFTYLRNVITAAEAGRMDKKVSEQAIDCAALVPMPASLTLCKVRQDAKATYAYAQSKDGKYYAFDGTVLREVSAPPAGF